METGNPEGSMACHSGKPTASWDPGKGGISVAFKAFQAKGVEPS